MISFIILTQPDSYYYFLLASCL